MILYRFGCGCVGFSPVEGEWKVNADGSVNVFKMHDCRDEIEFSSYYLAKIGPEQFAVRKKITADEFVTVWDKVARRAINGDKLTEIKRLLS